MHLATAYLQGIDISTNLILEGNYIKAAATLKQDYEIMIRFNEIHKGKAKDGKTPNAKYGPETFRDFYGYLNNIAHPSKIGVINKILNYQTEDFKQSISFVKQLQKGVAHRLITYNAAIKLEILRHILKAYFDIAGNNENYEKGLKHYLIIEKTYTKIGMFEQR